MFDLKHFYFHKTVSVMKHFIKYLLDNIFQDK